MTITIEKNIILQLEIVEKTYEDSLNTLTKIPGVVYIEMLDSYQESVDKYGFIVYDMDDPNCYKSRVNITVKSNDLLDCLAYINKENKIL